MRSIQLLTSELIITTSSLPKSFINFGHTFFEETEYGVGMAVEGGDMGECGPVFGPLHDGGLEFLRKKVYDSRVAVFGCHVNRSAI